MIQNFLMLDIDGPLLPGKFSTFKENYEYIKAFKKGMKAEELFEKHPPRFDPWCIRAHDLLLRHGNAKVVMVTNWRRWASIDQITSILKSQGLDMVLADRPECIRRGLSSERVHDVACHLEDYLPNNSRALIIDDANLLWLNEFFPLENDNLRIDKNQYNFLDHDDRQVGYIKNKNIRWKWLDVDYVNGLSYEQFKLGMDFFEVNWEEYGLNEFGIKIKTEEEKKKEREDLDLLLSAI